VHACVCVCLYAVLITVFIDSCVCVCVFHIGSVCLDEFESKSVVKELPCHHAFHSECIDEWLSRKNDCPNCREKVRGNTGRVTPESSLNQPQRGMNVGGNQGIILHRISHNEGNVARPNEQQVLIAMPTRVLTVQDNRRR
jgi:hypothetical protein